MLAYPYLYTADDNGSFLITFPDIPEALAVANDLASIEQEALDGLLCALDGYISDKRIIPMPSADGNVLPLPAMESLKILLSNEMLTQGVKKSEMAQRLNVHAPQIDRLLDLRHNTKLSFIEQAASQLGKRVNIQFA